MGEQQLNTGPKELVEQLFTYGTLLNKARTYRQEHEELHRILSGIEKGEWSDSTRLLAWIHRYGIGEDGWETYLASSSLASAAIGAAASNEPRTS